MYFSRIRIDIQSATPEDLETFAKVNAYGIHQILWRLFPNAGEAKRDFLYRIESHNELPFFYMVSKRRPVSLGKLLKVETKPYTPQLYKGQRLTFSLKVNPVVTKKHPATGKRLRHDVIMDAKYGLTRPFSTNTELSTTELEYKEGIKWLADRSANLGFEFGFDMVQVFGYHQHVFKKKNQKNAIRFSTLDYYGELTVIEPDRFYQTLAKGIGPAKAFGCGLMLLRRI
ncbi:MAG: type I-E CRISPR-associated protein Cas6/Cse3/CasE [Desulfobacterales bacterium]